MIRTYEANLEKHVYEDLGDWRLSDVRRRDVQALADRLVADGASGSKVRNVITALKVVYRRELEHDDLAINPTTNLRLPDVDSTREWDATPEEALSLLEALDEEKALYATALLAGLRRGELRALRVSDVHGLEAEAGERWQRRTQLGRPGRPRRPEVESGGTSDPPLREPPGDPRRSCPAQRAQRR